MESEESLIRIADNLEAIDVKRLEEMRCALDHMDDELKTMNGNIMEEIAPNLECIAANTHDMKVFMSDIAKHLKGIHECLKK